MRYEETKRLSNREFKRLVGVQRLTFDEIVKVLQDASSQRETRGCYKKLCLEDQALVRLMYWREYRTYFHIASDWQVSEATVCRTVHWLENILVNSGRFRLRGKKSLLTASQKPKTVAMDVTESPIERPKYGQKHFFSGKQKRHTLKSQFVIDLETLQVICVVNDSGRRHDFKLFIHSKVRFHPDTESLEDSGYQGIAKFHANSRTPRKQPRRGKLTKEDKQFNRGLARRRVAVEHVNRRLKIFRIFSQRYRNRRKRFALRCHLIPSVYNYNIQNAC
ncbi:IS5 family transposase [Nostoc sp. DedQUE09]|uniref:IS5 family transposase n=1 Tax=Nostoc sp. DedQUE09 TaxID=3075394 RepID=UPI002AD22827|nr:IS5 family transposase [Nostoc sp. DedQUE09]MDZ7955377.1 IS5 family transposase [Nostoc sp. DedQUE09]